MIFMLLVSFCAGAQREQTESIAIHQFHILAVDSAIGEKNQPSTFMFIYFSQQNMKKMFSFLGKLLETPIPSAIDEIFIFSSYRGTVVAS